METHTLLQSHFFFYIIGDKSPRHWPQMPKLVILGSALKKKKKKKTSFADNCQTQGKTINLMCKREGPQHLTKYCILAMVSCSLIYSLCSLDWKSIWSPWVGHQIRIGVLTAKYRRAEGPPKGCFNSWQTQESCLSLKYLRIIAFVLAVTCSFQAKYKA